MVVSRPPCSPQVYRYRQGPILCQEGTVVLSPRVDGDEAKPQEDWKNRHL